jgi:hypothetical protein
LAQIYTEAQAAGIDVIAMTTTPAGNYVSWTAPEQIEIEELNAAILASTDTDVTVDLYSLMGAAPPDGPALPGEGPPQPLCLGPPPQAR